MKLLICKPSFVLSVIIFLELSTAITVSATSFRSLSNLSTAVFHYNISTNYSSEDPEPPVKTTLGSSRASD